jgi:hypothetical protein
MTDILIEGKGKRKSKRKDKGKSNRRSFDSLRSLRMTAFFGGMTVIEALLMTDILIEGNGKRKSKSKDKGKATAGPSTPFGRSG